MTNPIAQWWDTEVKCFMAAGIYAEKCRRDRSKLKENVSDRTDADESWELGPRHYVIASGVSVLIAIASPSTMSTIIAFIATALVGFGWMVLCFIVAWNSSIAHSRLRLKNVRLRRSRISLRGGLVYGCVSPTSLAVFGTVSPLVIVSMTELSFELFWSISPFGSRFMGIVSLFGMWIAVLTSLYLIVALCSRKNIT